MITRHQAKQKSEQQPPAIQQETAHEQYTPEQAGTIKQLMELSKGCWNGLDQSFVVTALAIFADTMKCGVKAYTESLQHKDSIQCMAPIEGTFINGAIAVVLFTSAATYYQHRAQAIAENANAAPQRPSK